MAAVATVSRILTSSNGIKLGNIFLRSKSDIAVRNFSIKYSKSHEFINLVGGVGTVGISEHAAAALGDVVYVALPEVGSKYSAGESFGSVESVKAASDVYAPVSGEVIEVNSELEQNPGTVNESPYEKGWFIKIKVDDKGTKDYAGLLDESAYKKLLESLEH